MYKEKCQNAFHDDDDDDSEDEDNDGDGYGDNGCEVGRCASLI